MALHFKKNIFWCWEKDGITKCIIGLTFKKIKSFFDFRDRLASNIANKKNLYIKKQEGEPTKIDSLVRLFDKNNQGMLNSFSNEKRPSFVDSLFKTDYYKSWHEKLRNIADLVKITIETTHDFSGILIESTMHSPGELAIEIKNTSKELGFELDENCELENINIYSNHTFE